MRRQTPFTIDEAKAYITESITVWETSGIPTDTDKIISLANNAYNRRVKKNTASDALKIKAVKKTIRSLELTVKRNKQYGFTTDLYENEITRLVEWVEKAEAKLLIKKAK